MQVVFLKQLRTARAESYDCCWNSAETSQNFRRKAHGDAGGHPKETRSAQEVNGTAGSCFPHPLYARNMLGIIMLGIISVSHLYWRLIEWPSVGWRGRGARLWLIQGLGRDGKIV